MKTLRKNIIIIGNIVIIVIMNVIVVTTNSGKIKVAGGGDYIPAFCS
ncbi:hypothetical protein [Paenibacillus kribbensis]|nr:hypothetical protein [Paenibacillus kribbensis]